MPKQLVVVGLDRTLYRPSLVKETVSSMEELGWVDLANGTKKSTRRMVNAIGRAVTGHEKNEVEEVALTVVDKCAAEIDEEMVARLKEFPPDQYDVATICSAPAFVVEPAAERLCQETGLEFSTSLGSMFQVKDGEYTGRFKILDKHEAVRTILARAKLPNVAVAFINGEKDLEWARRFSREVVPVNPGEGLERLVERGRV